MTFNRIDASHLQIPGKMDVDEMAFLAALAALVPAEGHIVEVGPFYGRSTCVIGRANPNVHITSIDTFQDVAWTQAYADNYEDIPAFGQEAFTHFTRDLPRSTAIVGSSPDVVADWTKPIDMYFEDAVHGGPILKRNMAFWISHLKPGGIACGHDYTLRFPDVKREVDLLAKSWGTKLEVVGSLWALRKPHKTDTENRQTRGLAMGLTKQSRLKIRTKNKHKGADKTLDGFWCGAHMEVDRLSWISLDSIEEQTGIKLEYRVGHHEFGSSDWMTAGERVRLLDAGSRPKPFNRFAVRVSGAPRDGPMPKIACRVSARQIGNGGSLVSGSSNWAFDGEWAMVKPQGPSLNAVCVALFDHPPLHPQAHYKIKASLKPQGQKVLRRLAQKIKVNGSETLHLTPNMRIHRMTNIWQSQKNNL
ncbi:MAG: class I SAM-dependent methyltransferase [Aliishimia sp.]